MKTSYDIIIKPIISEQSMEAVDLKKYAFKVDKTANKTEIEKVTTTNVPGKKKRQGRYPEGKTADWKKAVVKLTDDSKTIEFFEGMV